jgi:hypothetical protein
MTLLLAMLLMPTVGGEIVDEVGLIEVNQLFDDKGLPVLKQVIFYDWNAQMGRHDVVAWSLFKPDMRIERSVDPRKCQVSWHDGDTLRIVKAPLLTVTFLQHDPEMRARAILPQNMRRGLTKKDAPAQIETDLGLVP